MSIYSPTPIYSKPLFQRALIFFILFLILAALFWIFGFGRPNLAVTIALDLSSSTHNGIWNAPSSIMAREIEAVNTYLGKNAELANPNQIQVLGFGSTVKELTSGFQSDSSEVAKELSKSLAKINIRDEFIKSGTDLDLVIGQGIDSLKVIGDRCREILLVTDGDANVSPNVVSDAIANKVRLNSVIIGNESPAVLAASIATGGTYNSANVSELNILFGEKIFGGFNSNIRWVILWLGCAWIAMMWMLTHPLEWFFEKVMGYRYPRGGNIAIGNSLFWTVATPGIVWRLTDGLAFLTQC